MFPNKNYLHLRRQITSLIQNIVVPIANIFSVYIGIFLILDEI